MVFIKQAQCGVAQADQVVAAIISNSANRIERTGSSKISLPVAIGGLRRRLGGGRIVAIIGICGWRQSIVQTDHIGIRAQRIVDSADHTDTGKRDDPVSLTIDRTILKADANIADIADFSRDIVAPSGTATGIANNGAGQ